MDVNWISRWKGQPVPKCIPSGTPLGDVPGTLRWQVHGTPKLGIAGKDHGFFIWFSSVLKCMFCPLPYLHNNPYRSSPS